MLFYWYSGLQKSIILLKIFAFLMENLNNFDEEI